PPHHAPSVDDHTLSIIPDLVSAGCHPLRAVHISTLEEHLEPTGLLRRGGEECFPVLLCFGILHLRALDTSANLYGIGTLDGAHPEESASILAGILDHLIIPESPENELNIVFLLEKIVVCQAGFGKVIRRHPTGGLFKGTVPEKQGLEDISGHLEIL